jgi:rRNA maturation RNase YbeY
MKVRFNYADRKLPFSPKSALKEIVKTIFSTEKVEARCIDYIFSSDEYLLEINRNALNHDYYTDIITFPLQEEGLPVEAEIYISIDRVKENAIAHNETFKNEIARVIAHGALHLCGYKDKLKADIIIMRERELFYIKNI